MSQRQASKPSIALALLIAAVAAVMGMDYEDEKREFEHYCQMVSDGHWPDYRNQAENCP